MKYSFIIPAYNSEKCIIDCLLSICRILLDRKDYEIIVVENGSTDYTYNVVDNFIQNNDFNVNLIKSEKGVSKARNAGIEMATGEFVIFLDSDDLLIKEGLQDFESIAEDYDLYIYSYKKKKNNKNEVSVKHTKSNLDSNNAIKWLMSKPTNRCQTWSKIFRNDILKKYKVKFKENIKYSEDSEFVLNYCKYIKKCYISDVALYMYIVNSSSAMNNMSYGVVEEYIKSMNYTKLLFESCNIDNYIDKYVLSHLNIILVRFVYSSKSNISNKRKLTKRIIKEETFQTSLKRIKKRECFSLNFLPELFIKLKMLDVAIIMVKIKVLLNEKK